MPLNITLLPSKDQTRIKNFAEELPKALEKARNQVNGGSAAAKLLLWFGGSDNATKIEIRDKLAKLRTFVMNHNVQCRLRLDRPADENALADHVTGGIIGGGGASSLARLEFARGEFGGLGILNLSPNFSNLPEYAIGPVSAFGAQDKFQTVVHELSHIVLGTGDEKLNDGTTAYGGTAARLLATQDAAKARNNAENWGMFVE